MSIPKESTLKNVYLVSAAVHLQSLNEWGIILLYVSFLAINITINYKGWALLIGMQSGQQKLKLINVQENYDPCHTQGLSPTINLVKCNSNADPGGEEKWDTSILIDAPWGIVLVRKTNSQRIWHESILRGGLCIP